MRVQRCQHPIDCGFDQFALVDLFVREFQGNGLPDDALDEPLTLLKSWKAKDPAWFNEVRNGATRNAQLPMPLVLSVPLSPLHRLCGAGQELQGRDQPGVRSARGREKFQIGKGQCTRK